MGKQCCICGSKNTTTKALHAFPIAPVERHLWIDAVFANTGIQIKSKFPYIYSDHFSPNSFQGTIKLLKGSTPSIYSTQGGSFIQQSSSTSYQQSSSTNDAEGANGIFQKPAENRKNGKPFVPKNSLKKLRVFVGDFTNKDMEDVVLAKRFKNAAEKRISKYLWKNRPHKTTRQVKPKTMIAIKSIVLRSNLDEDDL